MNNFKPFSSAFHCHTDRSLDGGSTPKTMVQQAKKLGMNAFAVTEHGNMASIYDLYELCKKEGLIFVPGIEAYIIEPTVPSKTAKNGSIIPGYCHLTIHFKDLEAYEYFCRISYNSAKRAVKAGTELKPLITWDELREISGHITISTGCFDGPVQKLVRLGDYESAEKNYLKIKSIAGEGNFFVELMCHVLNQEWVPPKFSKNKKDISVFGYFKDNDIDPETGKLLDIQRKPNLFAIQLAKKYNDPIILGHDAHIATEDDWIVQDIRLGHFWRFSVPYKLMTPGEVFANLKEQLGDEWTEQDHLNAIENGYKHSDLFKNFKLRSPSTDGWMLPTVQTIYGNDCTKTSKEILLDIIEKKGRLPTDERRQIYIDRLNHEIDVFTNHGADVIPYILCIHDVVEHEKKSNNLVSLRGSAAGSVIYYLIGMSPVDPIKYKLSFERHITPDRIKETLADVDADIGVKDSAINYTRFKYGDKCVLISTTNLMRVKNAIKEIERKKLGAVRPETNIMTTLLPSTPQGLNDIQFLYGFEDSDGNHVQGLLETSKPGVDLLKKYIEDNPEIWNIVTRCLGVAQSRGVHAAGVIIAPTAVHNFLPVIQSKDGDIVTDYVMKPVEAQRGVKFDFLGLRALEIISEILRYIKETTGDEFEWNEYPHDENVYKEIIQKNKLAGIFQLCSEKALRPWTQKFKIKSIEDISNLVALIRPGSLDQIVHDGEDQLSAAQFFVDCENGIRKPTYIHPDLIPMLKKTHGICLYQEQISEIFAKIGNLSAVESIHALKAISKKDRNKLEKYCNKLSVSCKENQFTDEQIKLLIGAVMASAKYSFNCIAGDQKIHTKNGLKRMDEITSDDEVACANDRGEIEYSFPIFSGQTGHKEVWTIELSDKSIVRATPDHKFMTEKGWMSLRDIVTHGADFVTIKPSPFY